MELRWLGHACFTVTHNGYTLVIDPYNADYIPGYPKLRGVKADKLLISHDSYGHNYIPGIVLSGRPESDCPFTITPMEVWHDTVCGIMRGSCLIHLIEADGLRVAHMGDIGAPLTGEQLSKLYDLDAMMITAGSCTALPSQEVFRLAEELFPKVLIPMHYRDGKRGPRRLEHVEELTKHYAPAMVRHYDQALRPRHGPALRHRPHHHYRRYGAADRGAQIPGANGGRAGKYCQKVLRSLPRRVEAAYFPSKIS